MTWKKITKDDDLTRELNGQDCVRCGMPFPPGVRDMTLDADHPDYPCSCHGFESCDDCGEIAQLIRSGTLLGQSFSEAQIQGGLSSLAAQHVQWHPHPEADPKKASCVECGRR